MLYTPDHVAELADALAAALPRWGLAGRPELLTVSENATFRLDPGDGGAPVVLRVYRPGYHSDAEIASELAWIEALRADRAVLTPRPIPAEDGARFVTLATPRGPRRAAAFAVMPGREPAPGPDLPAWFERLGAVTARLHAHARGWRRPPGFVRKRWDFATVAGPAAHWGDWRRAPGLDAPGRALLERLAARLAAETAAFGTGPDRFGLVHCDLRLANLLVEDDRLAVIDFDDCGFSWFGYDFAAAVSFIEDDPALPALVDAWVAGYSHVAPLADASALPLFVMLRRLQLTAWIGTHAETPTAISAGGAAFTAGTLALAERYLSSAARSAGDPPARHNGPVLDRVCNTTSASPGLVAVLPAHEIAKKMPPS